MPLRRLALASALVLLVTAAFPALGVLSIMDDGVSTLSTSTAGAGAPRGLHLSFTDDPATTMTITWFTDGIVDPGTLVEYGHDPSNLSATATGSAFPLTLAPDTLVHTATMTGLTPGKTFYYRVGGGSGWSDVHASHTIPDDGPFRIALYGDQGIKDHALNVRDTIMDADPDLVLIAGDLSYAEGVSPEWDTWFDNNEPLFSTTPMLASTGNHEGYSAVGTLPFQERLALPGEEVYYSIEVGNVHFLVLSSTTSDARSEGFYEEMIEFAAQDLEQAYEAKKNGEIDHITLLQHHPLYSNTANVGRWINAELAAIEEQWFHRFDVNIVLFGHNHNYERSYPMAYQVPTTFEPSYYEDPAGWIQVISGGGGKSLYSFKHPDDFLPYSAVHAQKYHFTQLDVDGERIDVTAIESSLLPGSIIDEFTLVDTDAEAPLPATVPAAPLATS